MDTKIIKIMILNWIFFLLSPIIVIIINSMTLFKVVTIGSDMSGTYTPWWGMAVILLYSLVLLGCIFYFCILGPAKITKSYSDRDYFYKRVTDTYVFLAILSLMFNVVSKVSTNSILVFDMVAGFGLLWVVLLTFKTLRSADKSFMRLQITSQILCALLFLSLFYGWNV
ncbi:MAG: hypothetical protein ABF723_09995 [Lentilactobacillus hilgardii]|uniref:hypothetical protein n=2 Tax=Lentilactobacillus hilgardii TaxID=1588 RepID=UPI001CC1F6B1|nr:hypothetical protein [Lentilactobacillus hilgardii]MBZ2202423.1 hypothetical protein [Lentilactobacillus hilgardii]MBZ2204531.1 hypothetical protein [Lentilactobacillus hilgardii]